MEVFRWSLLKILHQRRWKDRWHSQHGYAAVIRFGNTNKIWSMTGVYPLSTLEQHLFSSHSPKISKGRSTSSTPTLLVLHSEMQWSAWCRHDYVQLFRRPGCSYVNDRFAFVLLKYKELKEWRVCNSISTRTFLPILILIYLCSWLSRGSSGICLPRSCTSAIYTCQVLCPELEHCVQRHSTLQCADEKPAFCNQDVFVPFRYLWSKEA